MIRAAYARSYGALVSVSGSTHNSGYHADADRSAARTADITPTFTLDTGFPPYNVPPFINPAVSNGTNVAWFQGNETTKLPAYDNFNFSIQRQIGSSMVAEIAYSGVMGEHLQTSAARLQPDQPEISDRVRHGRAEHHGPEQPGWLRRPANAAGVAAPYPGVQRARSRRRCGRSRNTT